MLDIQKKNDGYTVLLVGELSIFDAQNLFEILRPVLLEKQNTTIDLENLVSIDTCVIQMLMFAKCFLKKHACELKLINHSRAVILLMERLGLVNWFGDPVFLSPDDLGNPVQGEKK